MNYQIPPVLLLLSSPQSSSSSCSTSSIVYQLSEGMMHLTDMHDIVLQLRFNAFNSYDTTRKYRNAMDLYVVFFSLIFSRLLFGNWIENLTFDSGKQYEIDLLRIRSFIRIISNQFLRILFFYFYCDCYCPIWKNEPCIPACSFVTTHQRKKNVFYD